MTSLPLADHPAHWHRPVQPADIDTHRLHLAPRGATAAGTRADALLTPDDDEVDRRAHYGLTAVPALHLLDALGSLPVDYPIRVADLTAAEERTLREAPSGCVTFDGTTVTRTLRPPATVAAALVQSDQWRSAIRRTRSFASFTQRIIVRHQMPTTDQLVEAQFVGVGIWVKHHLDGLQEILPAEPFRPTYFKAAGWRFAEKAFGAYMNDPARATVAIHACC